MKKLQMSEARTITFEQGCNMYLDNCRQRNLREGTINHYKQSYTQFYKYFNPQMPITDMTQDVYKQFVMHLRETLHKDVSFNPSLKSGKLNVSELARVCDMSRTTVYKYVSLLEK